MDPQIIVGLLVNRAGFPLEIGCWEGNKAETTTMLPIIRQFQDRHSIEAMVVVADAGMLSAGNLKDLHEAGLRFIVGSRATKAPADLASHFRWHGDAFTDGQVGCHPGTTCCATSARTSPIVGGEPGVDFPLPDPDTTEQVLQFRVAPATAPDPSTPAEFLTLPAITPLPPQTGVRRLALLEHEHTLGEGGPTAALLGAIDGDPSAGVVGTTHLMWMDPVTENPAPGDTEVWELYNLTADAHPVHLHEVAFEVVDRQPITAIDGFVSLDPDSPRAPALPGETGRKDTVIAYPEQVTRVRATFATAGQYVWHCHIVEHEDNEMMRPFRVGPLQPGQPE